MSELLDMSKRIPAMSKAEYDATFEIYLEHAHEIAQRINDHPELYDEWGQRAVCFYMGDKDVWFSGPEGGSNALRMQYDAIAKAVCELCTVRDQCYQQGIDTDDDTGTRAGITAEERKLNKRRAALARASMRNMR